MGLTVLSVFLFVLTKYPEYVLGQVTTTCSARAQYCPAGIANVANPSVPLRMEVLRSRNSTFASRAQASESFIQRLKEIEGHFADIVQLNTEANKNTICGGTYKAMVDWSQFIGYRLCSQCSQTVLQDEESVRRYKGTKIDIDSFMDSLSKLSRELEEIGPHVALDYGFNWTTVYPNIHFLLDDRSDKFRDCELYRTFGYRTRGKWNIAVKIYNLPADINAGGRQQQHITEYLSTSGTDRVESLLIDAPECSRSSGQRLGFGNRGSATVQYWHGTVDMSMFPSNERIELEDNVAISTSQDLSEHQKELVQDVDATSNAAILLLPVIMAFFPIGAFQEVSFFATVIYSIATDVISVVPILIKGAELVHYSRNQHQAMFARISGDRQVAAMEAYVSRCTLRPRVRGRGVTYILIALFSMIAGISLELIFWHRKKIGRERFTSK